MSGDITGQMKLIASLVMSPEVVISHCRINETEIASPMMSQEVVISFHGPAGLLFHPGRQ